MAERTQIVVRNTLIIDPAAQKGVRKTFINPKISPVRLNRHDYGMHKLSLTSLIYNTLGCRLWPAA